jgi:hypothetical protein
MNTEAFWSQVAVYNQTTWAFQTFLVVAAVILTGLVVTKPSSKTDTWMKAFLAFAFAWNSVTFFLIFVKNPISTFFGAPIFIVLAILLAVDVFTKNTEFRLTGSKMKKAFTVLWILLVFLYPLVGLSLGHTYPRMLTPVMPCPLTVFTLAMVAAAIPKVDRKLYILLLPWALAGLPKCLGALDCYEDCILFAAGVYGLILLVKDWKAISTFKPVA